MHGFINWGNVCVLHVKYLRTVLPKLSHIVFVNHYKRKIVETIINI